MLDLKSGVFCHATAVGWRITAMDTEPFKGGFDQRKISILHCQDVRTGEHTTSSKDADVMATTDVSWCQARQLVESRFCQKCRNTIPVGSGFTAASHCIAPDCLAGLREPVLSGSIRLMRVGSARTRRVQLSIAVAA